MIRCSGMYGVIFMHVRYIYDVSFFKNGEFMNSFDFWQRIAIEFTRGYGPGSGSAPSLPGMIENAGWSEGFRALALYLVWRQEKKNVGGWVSMDTQD